MTKASQPTTASIAKDSERSRPSGRSPAAYGRAMSASVTIPHRKTTIPLCSRPLPETAGMPERPADGPPRQHAADDDGQSGDRGERPASPERATLHAHSAGSGAYASGFRTPT